MTRTRIAKHTALRKEPLPLIVLEEVRVKATRFWRLGELKWKAALLYTLYFSCTRRLRFLVTLQRNQLRILNTIGRESSVEVNKATLLADLHHSNQQSVWGIWVTSDYCLSSYEPIHSRREICRIKRLVSRMSSKNSFPSLSIIHHALPFIASSNDY